MLNTRTLVAVVVAGTGLATAAWLPARHDTADASERSRHHRTHGDEQVRTPLGEPAWDDEFDAPAGTPVDPARWRLDTGDAVHDGDGNLVVTARRERSSSPGDTSARLVMTGMVAPRYGRVEARLRASREAGLRPVFQILSTTSTGSDNDDGSSEVGRPDAARARLDRGFRTYALDWSPDLLVWSVDGTEYRRVTPGSPNGEFSLLLNLAVDGDRPGRRDGRTRFPRQILVDHVRVWAYGPDGTPPSTAPPGSTTPAPPPSTEPPTTAPPPSSEPPSSEPPTTAPPSTVPPSTAPPTTVPPTTVPPSTAPPTTAPPSTAPAAKKWAPFTVYAAGQKVTYDGVTYQVRESHTSLPDWEPPAVPALFKAV